MKSTSLAELEKTEVPKGGLSPRRLAGKDNENRMRELGILELRCKRENLKFGKVLKLGCVKAGQQEWVAKYTKEGDLAVKRIRNSLALG